MIETNNPEINVDELMQRIREEVQQRKASAQADNNKNIVLETLPQYPKQPDFELKERYHINDFLQFHDSDFIKNAYLGILKRHPDQQGFAFYLNELRQGQLKEAILARLRFSPEGRAKAVSITGIRITIIQYTLSKIPVVGYLIELVLGILKLPTLRRNLRQFQAYSMMLQTQHQEYQTGLVQHITTNQQNLANYINNAATKESFTILDNNKVDKQELSELRKQLQELEEQKVNQAEIGELRKQLQQIEQRKINQEEIGELRKQLQELEERKVSKEEIKSLDTQIKETTKRFHQVKREGIFQQRRLNMLLEEARKRLPQPFDQQQLETLAKEADHSLDAFYVAFEDEFRGTREDIKERAEIYLPIIQEAKAGSEERPILDVGCGRGEWLELLKEHKYKAKGLDLNRIMIEQCQGYELDVIESDVIEYLKKQQDNSLGAITGFHIIEHLPFEILVTLFDESLRVLKPGGIVIFETPNPENLIVGACNFYTDPTHKNPIPPHTLEFLTEARGFNKIKILRLHEIDSLSFDNNFLHHRFTVGQDYSVIGVKA